MAVVSDLFSRRVHAALHLRAILRRVDAAAKRSLDPDRRQSLRSEMYAEFASMLQ